MCSIISFTDILHFSNWMTTDILIFGKAICTGFALTRTLQFTDITIFRFFICTVLTDFRHDYFTVMPPDYIVFAMVLATC